jgi:hypothetical protein|tara:strand:+ start:492 stop:650 length:159 start_codon:yes stop_codon:yes gene_type:complete
MNNPKQQVIDRMNEQLDELLGSKPKQVDNYDWETDQPEAYDWDDYHAQYDEY